MTPSILIACVLFLIHQTIADPCAKAPCPPPILYLSGMYTEPPFATFVIKALDIPVRIEIPFQMFTAY